MPDSLPIVVNQAVEDCLQKVLHNLEITEYKKKYSDPAEGGGNFLGLISQIEVRGKDKLNNDAYFNFIVKVAPNGEAFRSFVRVNEVYDREGFVYNEVFGEFYKLQEERLISKPFKSIPRLYCSSATLNNEVLIMDNVTQFGFVQIDRKQPIDYATGLFIMKEMGRLHALSFALRDQKPNVFHRLSCNMDDIYFDQPVDSELHKTIRIIGRKALKSLDPVKHKSAYGKFELYLKRMTELTLKAVDSKSAGKYAVFTHGDLWLNNLLFKYKDSEKRDELTELCMIDWQMARLGSPALDISYFMYLCTDSNLRNKHYDQLIREYHNSLSSFLQELGSNPRKMFPFEALQNQLRDFSIYGLYMGGWVLSVLTSEEDEIPDINDLSGCQEVSKKFQYDSRNVERFYSRIRDVILDMDRFQYNFF